MASLARDRPGNHRCRLRAGAWRSTCLGCLGGDIRRDIVRRDCAAFWLLAKTSRPALVFAGLGVFTLAQSVPLPIAVLRRLSPEAAYVWTNALHPLGEHVQNGSLSLDPGASMLEAAKWTAYALAFSLAASMGRRRGTAYPIAIVLRECPRRRSGHTRPTR